jgi:transcription initiation factor TFIID subunit TAF12
MLWLTPLPTLVLLQVLCARCTSLSNGAMIPAVQDFTQKAWAEQQQQLLAAQGRQQQQQQEEESAQQQQQEQQQAPARRSRKASVTAGEEPPASAVDTGAAAAPVARLMPQQAVPGLDAGMSSETLELLGRVLVSPEQLRQKIAVSETC